MRRQLGRGRVTSPAVMGLLDAGPLCGGRGWWPGLGMGCAGNGVRWEWCGLCSRSIVEEATGQGMVGCTHVGDLVRLFVLAQKTETMIVFGSDCVLSQGHV
jgi:hypothetical protein